MQNEEKNTFRSTNQLQEPKHMHSPSNASNDQLLQSGLNIKQFSYLSPSQDSNQAFSFTKETIDQCVLLSSLRDKYNLIIASTLLEDAGAESSDLNQTIDSVIKGIEALGSFNITSSSALYIIFMQHIHRQEHYDHFFNKKQLSLFNNTNEAELVNDSSQTFQASLMSYYNNNTLSALQVLFIHRPRLGAIEALDCLYNDILPLMRSKDSMIHLVSIANGVLLSPDALNEMITLSNNSQSAVIIPQIETIPIGLFARIEHYSNYQYNIFNMNYYSMSRCLPINHSLFLMRIDDPLSDLIRNYFNTKINSDADIFYHDHLFSFNLTEQNFPIIYAKNTICSIKRNQITFGQMMTFHTDNMSGTFSSIFPLLSFWLKGKMTNVSIISKVSLMLLFIGMFFDFCFPSMMAIIIYSIFNEAFQIKDSRVSIFLTGLYLLLIILTTSFSVLSKKKNAESIHKLFLAFYIVFTVYYLFALVCSVPSMHFLNTNPSKDVYQFNIAAIASIIVINFVVGICPLLINAKSTLKKIVNALEYVTLGASGFTSVFLNHSIVNASDMIGGGVGGGKAYSNSSSQSVLNYYKAIVIALYAGTNAFFVCILFFLIDRTMRVNAVFSLGIIYTIYNCLKVGFVILGMFTGSSSSKHSAPNSKSQAQKKKKTNEEDNGKNENQLFDQYKHDDTNDNNINHHPNGAIKDRESFSIDHASNRNEKYNQSSSLEENGKKYDPEIEMKEKSIELNIIDRNESNESGDKDDDGNNSNKAHNEQETTTKRPNVNANDEEREDNKSESEGEGEEAEEEDEEKKDTDQQQHQKDIAEEDKDDGNNDSNKKKEKEKEDVVNQGINESEPKKNLQ